jgi:hypothetical protein
VGDVLTVVVAGKAESETGKGVSVARLFDISRQMASHPAIASRAEITRRGNPYGERSAERRGKRWTEEHGLILSLVARVSGATP